MCTCPTIWRYATLTHLRLFQGGLRENTSTARSDSVCDYMLSDAATYYHHVELQSVVPIQIDKIRIFRTIVWVSVRDN